jgi:hypothetical protein
MRNINLPKARVFVSEEAWGGNRLSYLPAWLVSVRALRGRQLCFQVWVDKYAACYDKIPPHCLFWSLPDAGAKLIPSGKVQMWECLSGSIELFHKAQLADVPVVVNLGQGEVAKGWYWWTIDFAPDAQGLGVLDVGDSELLEEHKEANAIRLENGQVLLYPNNRLKWCPQSLATEEAVRTIPPWKVAENAKWFQWQGDIPELLGDADWAY